MLVTELMLHDLHEILLLINEIDSSSERYFIAVSEWRSLQYRNYSTTDFFVFFVLNVFSQHRAIHEILVNCSLI